MNKKIINASPVKVEKIEFKSELEGRIYRTLLENGIKPDYEKKKFVLWKGFYPTVGFFNKSVDKKTRADIKDKNRLHLDTRKIKDITYTPDFTFTLNGIFIIMEAKGFENDVFPLKKKMFRKVLERKKTPVLFFEVYSKKNVLQALEIIKSYKSIWKQ